MWRGKQLLLGKRIAGTLQPCWQFPGGHLENGESVIACARREVQEETGLAITALRHLGFTDRSFNMDGRSYITLLVSAEAASGEARVREPDKCEHWQWFDYQRLPSPLFEPIEIFLSQQADLYRLHQSSVILSNQ